MCVAVFSNHPKPKQLTKPRAILRKIIGLPDCYLWQTLFKNRETEVMWIVYPSENVACQKERASVHFMVWEVQFVSLHFLIGPTINPIELLEREDKYGILALTKILSGHLCLFCRHKTIASNGQNLQPSGLPNDYISRLWNWCGMCFNVLLVSLLPCFHLKLGQWSSERLAKVI
jgi:hypothetical protein